MNNDMNVVADVLDEMIDKTKIKINNLKKELGIAEHQEKYLIELSRENDRNRNRNITLSIKNNLTNNHNTYDYNKKQLIDYIMFLILPVSLLEIIVNYAHHSTYSILTNYYQSVYISAKYHNYSKNYYNYSKHHYTIINNCVIEISFGVCYVVNIFTNELIDKYCIEYQCGERNNKKYKLLIYQNKAYVLENDVLLVLVIIIDTDNMKCDFVPIDSTRGNFQSNDDDENKEEIEFNKISIHTSLDNGEKLIIKNIITKLDLLLSAKTSIFGKGIFNGSSKIVFDFCKESFYVNEQTITLGFCVKSTQNKLNKLDMDVDKSIHHYPYILEYDLEKKQIINCYKIRYAHNFDVCGFKFIFDAKNNCVYVSTESNTMNNKVYTYKKN
jgi:hypothetical protein